jgi:asparagine synthase (glutamine-hydrolysing)
MLAHRGPEGQGICAEGDAAIAHRRPAVIDVSTGATQPFERCDHGVVLVFNGWRRWFARTFRRPFTTDR